MRTDPCNQERSGRPKVIKLQLCTAGEKTGGLAERGDKTGRVVPEAEAISREQKEGRIKRKAGSESFVKMFSSGKKMYISVSSLQLPPVHGHSHFVILCI